MAAFYASTATISLLQERNNMADIELTTVPTETTIDIANDLMWFVDVSETPDAINKFVPKTLRDAIFPGVLWANDYATLQDAVDALKASSTAKKLMLSGQYTITSTVTVDDCDNKIIEGNGANIHCTGSSTIYALNPTNSANLLIRGIRFTSDGAGTHLGVVTGATSTGVRTEKCIFIGLFQGYVDGSLFRNSISQCWVTTCANAGILLSGEYCIASDNKVWLNTAIGIQNAGGNNDVIGNEVYGNAIGIQVNGTGVNGDHGLIANNKINHQTKCGIYLYHLDYSMNITGNEIWATGSSGAVDLGGSPKNSSFGIYIEQGKAVGITSNTFGRNKYNLGIEGLIGGSVISANRFLSDNTLTVRHAKETGGTNTDYLFTGNTLIDDLSGNTVNLASDLPGATIPAGTNLVI